MYDSFKRNITYVRISVTDRCNMRCVYCMPEDGVVCTTHENIISFEEICHFLEVMVPMGITKVRLTGGEPTVRKGIVNLIQMITEIKGIEDIGITTNGLLLESMAVDLFDAGLRNINISLDTLDSEKFSKITRGASLNKVLAGIYAAKHAGFKNIKINTVRLLDTTAKEYAELEEFCAKEQLQHRYIRQMNLEKGEFSVVEGGSGGDCKICNRIRLTAQGEIKPCLFSNESYSIKQYGVEQAVRLAILNKPQCGTQSDSHKFYNIGG